MAYSIFIRRSLGILLEKVLWVVLMNSSEHEGDHETDLCLMLSFISTPMIMLPLISLRAFMRMCWARAIILEGAEAHPGNS